MDYKVPDKAQVYGEDIQPDELRYHVVPTLVVKEFTFDAAHHLHAYEGKCKNMHGHLYRVQFGVVGIPNPIGIVIDFGDIKKIWKEHLEPRLDHRYLNESLPNMNTSAENLVYWIYKEMEKHLPKNVLLEFVRLYETPTCYAEIHQKSLPAAKVDNPLSLYSTADLTEELKRREGISTYWVPNEKHAWVSVDGRDFQVKGSAVILVNID